MSNGMLKTTVAVILLCVCACSYARVYLVSVGIADYSGYPSKISDLRLPANDADAVVALYSQNASVDYALLLNGNATKDRIVRAIKKVFGMAGKNDIAVFFFSGHGYAGGFCAYDGNISYSEVRHAMSNSKCRNKMMFVDACRSGGMRVNRSSAQSVINESKAANVMLFLSSRNNENSIERSNMENGFFTTFLQRGLKGGADTNHDRIITARELYDFVHDGVAQISEGKQHPVMWGNFNSDMPVMKW